MFRCNVKLKYFVHWLVGIYMFKVGNRNTRTRCEICSKLTIKTKERHHLSFWCLYCQLWTYFILSFSAAIVNFEQVNAVLIPFRYVHICLYLMRKHFLLSNIDILILGLICNEYFHYTKIIHARNVWTVCNIKNV